MKDVILSSKYQITIPKEVREEHNFKPGTVFRFVSKGRHLELIQVPTADELFGMAEGADTSHYRDRKDRV